MTGPERLQRRQLPVNSGSVYKEYQMEDSKPDQTPGDDITLTADALKAMGHPLRWKILCTLGNSEMSVGEIVEKIGTSQMDPPASSTATSLFTRHIGAGELTPR